MSLTKVERRNRIRLRIRKIVSGTAEKPRMAIFRSNKQIYAQVIDDLAGKTIVSVSSTEKEIAGQAQKRIDQAKVVGKLIAERSLEKGIKEVVFDRGGYLYHGRVKQLADAARENGLKF
jgi:large subunit ribosomal protein L18